eukprot:GHVH01001247.1.p1 GENE.GHVH01001247.1~~GHVH01001247.1.p1  ORF type:complete len:261 (+),score=30.41 GHVH01001247.1:43-825(+)
MMPENFTLSKTISRPGKDGVDKITLAYWDIRGLGNGPRQLCEYLEVPYEDVRYSIKPKDDGSYDMSSYNPWFEYKKDHLKEFPFHLNLPYLINGDTKLVQTRAILYYIAEKFGRPSTMGGTTPENRAQHYRMVETVHDINSNAVPLYYKNKEPSVFKTALTEFLAGEKMKKFQEDFVGQLGDKKFLFSNDELSVADLTAYDFFDTVLIASGMNAKFDERIHRFLASVEGIDQISKYHKSGVYDRYTCNNKIAVNEGSFKW